MCWRYVTVTGSLDTGAVHALFESSTRSGSESENTPLARCPGSPNVSVASPAVEITFALEVAVYSWSRPGVNGPKLAAGPRLSESVAGTEPATPPDAVVAW